LLQEFGIFSSLISFGAVVIRLYFLWGMKLLQDVVMVSSLELYMRCVISLVRLEVS